MGRIKQLKGKIIFKHETEKDWEQSNYIPDSGEKVLYDPDERHNYTRTKYGDGETLVKDLPFSNIQGDFTQTDSTKADYIKNKPELGALSAKDEVLKTDLASDVQASLDKADSALQSYTETDPTVPAWAKSSSKPTYTASEVGAVPTSRTVNGKALSENITLSASDVGALPSTTDIPDALSDLTDDSTHRTVTDAEKATWNAKSNFNGNYNSLTNKPTLGSLAAKDQVVKADLSTDLQTAIDRVDFANGGTMGGSLVINGDLTVNGTATTVEIFNENVNVEDNTITLRHNTTTGLSNGDYTGIIAHKYDGTNNGMLVFDNTGTAYVGDEGDLQPLATRKLAAEDNGELVSWDAANQTLVKAPVTVENIVTKDNFDSLNTVLSTNTNNAEMSYVKDVPSDSANYAAVQKIGGMTYKDGDTLRSAKVTEVKSVGANLAQPRADLKNWGCSASIASDGKITLTSTDAYPSIYARVATVLLKANTSYTVSFVNASSIQYGFVWRLGTTTHITDVIHDKRTFTPSEDMYVEIAMYMPDNSPVGTISSCYLMLNEGSTAQPYTPFVKHTLPIPEAVQALPDYGEGVNNSYQNVLKLDTSRYIRWVRRLLAGEKRLVNAQYSYENIVYYALNKGGTADYAKVAENILVSDFPIYTGPAPWDSSERIGTVTGNADYGWYWFGFPKGTTLEEAQAIIDNSDILVTLATAEITDISDLITADNLIGVEGGGTLTFENEYGYAVPSEVVFYNEKAETIAADKIVGNLIGVSTRAISDEDGNSIVNTYMKKSNALEVISGLTETQLQKLINLIDTIELE